MSRLHRLIVWPLYAGMSLLVMAVFVGAVAVAVSQALRK